MTYLILDTNIWIYLANSYNPKHKNYENGLHFKLVESLKKLIDSEDLVILTNDIIIEEWNRNKEAAKKLIEKYRITVEGNKNSITNIKKMLEVKEKNKLDEIFEKYVENIEKLIQDNERHIIDVEDLLINKSHRIEIPNKVKIIATDRAVKKLAPFKGNKSNSMADAVILLSSIEYLKNKRKQLWWIEEFPHSYPDSIFVTNNKGDFSDPNNESEIHEDLKPLLDEVAMKYEMNIGKIINEAHVDLIKNEEIKQIEKELDEEYWKNLIYCEECSPDPDKMYVHNIIEFGRPIQIKNALIEYYDPNQMMLFNLPDVERTEDEDEIKETDIDTVQFGKCTWCNTEYFKCQYCEATNLMEVLKDNNKIECTGCYLVYQMDSNYIGNGMYETKIKIIGSD